MASCRTPSALGVPLPHYIIYSHFREAHIIFFVYVTLLNDAVMSYVMSQCRTCIGHMTIYYKRAANASVGGFLPIVRQFVRFDSVTRDPHVASV